MEAKSNDDNDERAKERVVVGGTETINDCDERCYQSDEIKEQVLFLIFFLKMPCGHFLPLVGNPELLGGLMLPVNTNGTSQPTDSSACQ